MSTATSTLGAAMVWKFGILLELSLEEFWFLVVSQISASGRKERCFFALSRSCGGYDWLARRKGHCLAFEFKVYESRIMFYFSGESIPNNEL